MKTGIKTLVLAMALTLVSAASYGAFWSFGKDLATILTDIETKGADKSVADLEEYVADNPRGENSDEALLRLARVYAEKKDYDRAVKAYQTLSENFPESRFRADSLFEAGSIEYRTGRLREAKAALEAVGSDRYSTVTLKVKSALLLKEVDSASFGLAPRGEVPAIGVILPLKGPYAQFGEDALNGVLMAAGVFGAEKGSYEVIVRNAGDEAGSVEAAINELADNPRVVALVGPLLSSTAYEAAKQAHNRRIPIVTLSQREGIADGEYVFRNFLTSASQASAMAEYSCKTLGKTRTAILYPQNNYGSELARLFEKEVQARGCAVVKTASYPPGTTDFTDPMKRLFGIQVKERMEGRRKIKEYTSASTIDSLFIPDSYDSVGLIAPYLGFYNIKGVQLLGSNAWNSRKLIELGGKNVEGAAFVDGFFSGSRRPETSAFTGRFRDTFGKDPGFIEAQAYDAASAVIAADKFGGFDREAVRTALKRLKDFSGSTGPLSFSDRGEAVKKLFILTVRDGRITEAETR